MEANTAHLLIECMKLTYADRFAYLGDPDFVAVPTRGLVDKEYAAGRRKLIELDRALRLPVRRGEPARQDGCTTHISVIDRRGNCAAYTNTLSTLFGSAFVLPEYGFLLNDSLDDFDANATGPNKAEPWKRPKSAMSPMFVLGGDARPRLVLGAAGGNRIPGILFPILSSVLDHNRTVEQAVADPRLVNENRTLTASARHTQREPAPYDMAPSLIDALMARGQVVYRNPLPFGAAQGVEADPETGELRRGTDPRRGGEF
jgi:gamma-glutamyltranspeptidase/glutathione hydrolase